MKKIKKRQYVITVDPDLWKRFQAKAGFYKASKVITKLIEEYLGEKDDRPDKA